MQRDQFRSGRQGDARALAPQHVPPHASHAERSVLGCAMSGEKLLAQVVTVVRVDDFYEPAHKLIYEAITELMSERQPVDVVTVMNRLSLKGQLDSVGGIAYLNELTDAAPSLGNVRSYAEIVHQKSLMRALILKLRSCLDSCYVEENVNLVLDSAAQSLFDLRENRGSGELVVLSHVIDDVINEVMQMSENKQLFRGLMTGYPSLDQAIGGLKKGSLNILAARPAMGKSALAINIAHRVAQTKKNVALFSLEMSRKEIAYRVMSAQGRIEADRLTRGDLEKRDHEALSKVMNDLYSIGFYIDDRADTSPLQILSKCRQMRIEGKELSLIVVDYLQLMHCDGRHDSRQQEISEISRSLKLVAKELDIPVIALSQLSRAVEARQNKKPVLSDLRESGSIEQDADTVMFIYRDSYYQQDREEGPEEDAEVIIAKNRSGQTRTVNLSWLSRYTKFVDPQDRRPSDADAPPEYSNYLPPPVEDPFDMSRAYEDPNLPPPSQEDVSAAFGDASSDTALFHEPPLDDAAFAEPPLDDGAFAESPLDGMPFDEAVFGEAPPEDDLPFEPDFLQ